MVKEITTATMRGLCHSCFSTGTPTTFNDFDIPVCNNCNLQEKNKE